MIAPPHDSLTITVNNRLARTLERQRREDARRSGQTVWHQGEILPFDAWVRASYDTLLLRGQQRLPRVGAAVEALLWEQVLASDGEQAAGLALLNLGGAAEQVRAAWHLYWDYELETAALGAYPGSESAALIRWFERFEERCEAARVIDSARLLSRLAMGIEAGALSLPQKICFEGFDRLTPSQLRLQRVLLAAGHQINNRAHDQTRASRLSRFAGADADHELRQAIAWCQQRLAEDSAASVALVIPQLGGLRARVVAELDEAFDPLYLLEARRPKGEGYDLSLGRSLAELPLVHDALLLLRFASSAPLLSKELALLLRSPFFDGAAIEADARARWEVASRRSLGPLVMLRTYWELCQAPAQRPEVPPHWHSLIETLSTHRTRWDDRAQTASLWPHSLRALLDAVGWPGPRPLDSEEYQQRVAFETCLDELAAFEAITPGALPPNEIYGLLARLCRDKLFQPQGAHRARLHVLGALEASHQRFDHAWLLGFDEASWPPGAEPNGFLPLELQRKHGMPNSAPELRLSVARRLCDQLLAVADQIVVSHPLRVGETGCVPSPLIAALVERNAAELGLAPLQTSLDGRALHGACGHGAVDTLDDNSGLPLAGQVFVRGGSAVIADQASCPFRAFARHRLGVRGEAWPDGGIDAASYGSLVHRTLELLWRELGAHQALRAASVTELDSMVATALTVALDEGAAAQPWSFGPRLLALVRQRLALLIPEWLALESERAPFEIVALEKKVRLQLGPLQLELRVDRIDRLLGGGEAIIDYKTGARANHRSWQDPRIEEPQLPLYALQCAGRLEALVLARVRRDGAQGFDGIVAAACLFPGKTRRVELVAANGGTEGNPLAPLIERWRMDLVGLAEDFARADASRVPLRGACDNCELTMLCRKHETELEEGLA